MGYDTDTSCAVRLEEVRVEFVENNIGAAEGVWETIRSSLFTSLSL